MAFYRKSLKGLKSKDGNKSRVPFSEDLLKELFNLLLSLFPKYDNDELKKKSLNKEMRVAVSFKLRQLNKHFAHLIDPSRIDDPIPTLDTVGFEEYFKYKSDPNLFNELDQCIDVEESVTRDGEEESGTKDGEEESVTKDGEEENGTKDGEEENGTKDGEEENGTKNKTAEQLLNDMTS